MNTHKNSVYVFFFKQLNELNQFRNKKTDSEDFRSEIQDFSPGRVVTGSGVSEVTYSTPRRDLNDSEPWMFEVGKYRVEMVG